AGADPPADPGGVGDEPDQAAAAADLRAVDQPDREAVAAAEAGAAAPARFRRRLGGAQGGGDRVAGGVVRPRPRPAPVRRSLSAINRQVSSGGRSSRSSVLFVV